MLTEPLEKIEGLKAGRDALKALWKKGLVGKELLREHTRLIDAFIRESFEGCREDVSGMALIALGGYGRRELFPFSDIDLLLLHAPGARNRVSKVIESVLYPLWDAGLDVGHGVRTVEGCLEDSGHDFFFQVALLDARLLCGDGSLFERLMGEFRVSFVEGRRKAFAKNMMAHRNERHRRFGAQTYLLEPDVKESRGGLRDIQAVLWTSKVLFGLDRLENLSESGLFTDQERDALERAWENIIRIRNRLHYFSQRKNNRLFFEYQEEIAKALRYYDEGGMLGVERFMREVHGFLKIIAVFSDLFFEHVEEVLQLEEGHGKSRVLEQGVEILDGRIHLTDPSLLKKRSHLMMKVFAYAARTGFPVHHRTKRIVSGNLHLVDDKARSSKRFARAFFEIFRGGKDPLPILEDLLDTGLLSSYIPEFSHIQSLALHDVYHVYTVDRHSLQAVSEMHALEQEDPSRFEALESPRVVYLAALLHDVGKGRFGDHSEIGAEIAAKAGRRMGMRPEEVSALIFLVRNHLFLIDAALKRDLDEEAFIVKCARKIKDADLLEMLYLLSIADSKATGPHVWNDWKAALLLELHMKIVHLLQQSDIIDPDRIQAAEWMKQQVAERFSTEYGQILDILPEDYLLSFTVQEIEKHIRAKGKLDDQLVVMMPEEGRNCWSLLMIARDRTGLLARICGVLALHNLNVLAARIFTLKDGTAVDVLDVRSAVGQHYTEQDWDALKKDLTLALDDRLGLPHRLAGKFGSGLAAASYRAVGNRKASVVIDNETSDFFTIIEVYAPGRTELLYHITNTLADFGIHIVKAKIGSSGDQVVDVFYVLDKVGQRIEDESLQKELQSALVYAAK